MRRLAAVTSLAFCLGVAACGGDSGSTEPNLGASPTGGIDIRGKITQLSTPAPGVNMGALVVEGEVEPDTRYRRALIRMQESTVVQRRQGEEAFPASVVDLEVGKWVEVKFEGVVAELDPVQASAGEITILD